MTSQRQPSVSICSSNFNGQYPHPDHYRCVRVTSWTIDGTTLKFKACGDEAAADPHQLPFFAEIANAWWHYPTTFCDEPNKQEGWLLIQVDHPVIKELKAEAVGPKWPSGGGGIHLELADYPRIIAALSAQWLSLQK